MSESSRYLKNLAEHFAPRDWDYTRLHDIEHIRYKDDFQGYYTRAKRLKRAARAVFGKRKPYHVDWFNVEDLGPWTAVYYRLRSRIALAKVHLRTPAHRPDGVLNGGSVITHWEEDGEYLNLVQPSVGSMLADFLLAYPDHPSAVQIQAEIDRLYTRYTERISKGEVDGKQR